VCFCVFSLFNSEGEKGEITTQEIKTKGGQPRVSIQLKINAIKFEIIGTWLNK